MNLKQPDCWRPDSVLTRFEDDRVKPKKSNWKTENSQRKHLKVYIFRIGNFAIFGD